jgi:hypothetical protein
VAHDPERQVWVIDGQLLRDEPVHDLPSRGITGVGSASGDTLQRVVDLMN